MLSRKTVGESRHTAPSVVRIKIPFVCRALSLWIVEIHSGLYGFVGVAANSFTYNSVNSLIAAEGSVLLCNTMTSVCATVTNDTSKDLNLPHNVSNKDVRKGIQKMKSSKAPEWDDVP